MVGLRTVIGCLFGAATSLTAYRFLIQTNVDVADSELLLADGCTVFSLICPSLPSYDSCLLNHV